MTPSDLNVSLVTNWLGSLTLFVKKEHGTRQLRLVTVSNKYENGMLQQLSHSTNSRHQNTLIFSSVPERGQVRY